MVSKMVTDTQQGEVAVRDNRDEDEKAESFDLMTDCNVARIQEFLDAPFKRIGEAIQSVERRLEARGVTLTEELKRESKEQASGSSGVEEASAPPPAVAARSRAALAVRKANAAIRQLGPRSRFSDGDGSFWDRWMNDSGCLGGDGACILSASSARLRRPVSRDASFGLTRPPSSSVCTRAPWPPRSSARSCG